MSNKLELQEHVTELQSILDTINALPEAGAGDAYAVIAVTYPEGSVCTCSNGSETLELDNTVGYGFFLVPEAGEWIVTSTDKVDSTKTKSAEIEITKEGQFESVELVYTLILFDSTNGGDNTAVTGGWDSGKVNDSGDTSFNSVSVTVDATKLTLKANCNNTTFSCHGYGYTKNTIDLTNINTLYATVDSISTNDPYTTAAATLYIGEGPVSMAASSQITAPNTVSLDVSEYEGNYYIGIKTYCRNTGATTVSASKIWGV